jgi:hypothetical protein
MLHQSVLYHPMQLLPVQQYLEPLDFYCVLKRLYGHPLLAARVAANLYVA